MFSNALVVDGRNSDGNRPPRAIGSSASRLMKLIDGSHHDAELSAREQTIVRLWIESGAVYPGTYGALGTGIYTVKFPEATIRRRCAACHTATDPPYRNPKKGAFYFQFGKRQPPQPLLTDPDDAPVDAYAVDREYWDTFNHDAPQGSATKSTNRIQ